MSQYELTPQLKELISKSQLGLESKAKLFEQHAISRNNLVTFYTEYRPTSSLLELLKTTKIWINNEDLNNTKQEKTPEFIEQMEYLRLRAKEEEYQSLINPSPEINTLYESKFDDEFSHQTPVQAHKELRHQLTTIVNILISVGSVVYAIWYWTESSWGLPNSYRVLMCLFFGLLILVAETVVYLGYLNKIEDAKIRERKKKEVKTVVNTIKL